MFALILGASVQWYFFKADLTPIFTILVVYVFGVIHRLGVFTDRIMKQDQEIKELNSRIYHNSNLFTETVQKYGLTEKQKQDFKKKLKKSLTKKPNHEET